MKRFLYSAILLLSTLFATQAQCIKLMDFAGTANGANPYGDLYFDGTYLYGMTQYGGAHNDGLVFKVLPNGTGFVDLWDFQGNVSGSGPYGSLISDGTYLYGTTTLGGANLGGTIFKINKNGGGFFTLLDFISAKTGATANPSLFYDGNYLYGMTTNGGAHSSGTIFKLKTDSTGFKKIYDFNDKSTGGSPFGALISDGTFLYGMTAYGGPNSSGTIFKIKPDGNGYKKLLDFAGISNGKYPYGSLLLIDTFLYGMTNQGGPNNFGLIFKISTNGNAYDHFFPFAGTSNGSNPSGSLIYDGTYLYGMTGTGGTKKIGTIFKIKPDGNGFAQLHEFNGDTTGKYPYGSLTLAGGVLYGMTEEGGKNNLGDIFKFQLTAAGLSDIKKPLNFTIIPNPGNGKFRIKTDDLIFTQGRLEISNLLGETVYSNAQFNPQEPIDISYLPNGIYFLKYFNSEKCVYGKVVVEK